jgi:hypothetical protein
MSQIDQARDAQSNPQTPDALILTRYAEIASCAVQLARNKIVGFSCGSGIRSQSYFVCNVCGARSGVFEALTHEESCIIGRIFDLAAVIAALKAATPSPEHDRTIEYFANTTPAGELVPARRSTHEAAARSAQGATA